MTETSSTVGAPPGALVVEVAGAALVVEIAGAALVVVAGAAVVVPEGGAVVVVDSSAIAPRYRFQFQARAPSRAMHPSTPLELPRCPGSREAARSLEGGTIWLSTKSVSLGEPPCPP